MPIIRAFTKKPQKNSYPDGLARSIHFLLLPDHSEADPKTEQKPEPVSGRASETGQGREVELNHGYGILFAKGRIRDNGTIEPKCVRDPEIFRDTDGSFVLRAVRVNEDGTEEADTPDGKPVRLFWRSRDLIRFEEVNGEEAVMQAEVPAKAEQGVLTEKDAGADGGHNLSDRTEITQEEADRLLGYWNAPVGEQLGAFPQSHGLADPVFYRFEDRWYFIFTNDNLNDIGLYIREGDSVPELLKEETPMHCILNVDEAHGFIQNFWAPEFHVIGDDLYILFAVSGEEFGPCCHMMKLKKGGRLTEAASYETPVPVLRKNGSRLTVPEYKLTAEEREAIVPSREDRADDRFGISLDMTYLKDGGRSYMIWSFRQFIGTPLDSGSMIMIAETTEEKPWQLISDPVIISRPLYGYENVQGTINNEGPYVYRRDDMIHVNYSGGDARGYLYVVNLLSAKSGSDLLDPKRWKKRCTPLCNFMTYPGVYGPGHNSWFRDEEGREWIAFHGVDRMDGKKISVGVFEYPRNL